MEKPQDIKIKILKIREVNFSCYDIPENYGEIDFGKNLRFELAFQYLPDIENNLFKLKTKVNYLLDKVDNDVLSFTNEITFEVIGIKDVVKYEEKKNDFNINNDFLVSLLSVAIGTTRGMLAVSTRGKKIGGFPMPILNPKDVLEQLRKV